MNEEIWKEIKGYEGLYWVSNIGRVKSKRKILKLIDGEYLKVGLSKNGVQKTKAVHRLVAKAFVDNIDNKPMVNHKDENKHNNKYDNLMWCTNLENINYGKRNEKVSKSNSIYKITQKDKEGNIIKIWNNIWDLINNTGYKKDNIRCCCRGKYKYAYGYIWEYSTL